MPAAPDRPACTPIEFWALPRHGAATALVDEHGAAICGDALAALADAAGAGLQPREVFGLSCQPTRATVATYLGALRRGAVPLLLDAALDASARDALLAHYRIGRWMDGATGEWRSAPARGPGPVAHAQLGLLMSTSGSTASPKLVRLSRENLAANAGSIVQCLGLHASDVAITTLPLHYSFGLSLLNTHLACGGCTVLNAAPVTQADFWQRLRQHGVTSLSGVPTLWRLLRQLRFERMALPTVHSLTQAGGRLEPQEQAWLLSAAAGRRVYVMYGQTEATARIACVPPDLLARKLGSVGLAIPGGRLRVLDEAGQPVAAPGIEGQLAYRGPNVMLGYADGPADLARGAEVEELLTGDLGHLDADGCCWITGRLKRFIKLQGHRVSLDDVENGLRSQGLEACAVGRDDRLLVAVVGASRDASRHLATELVQRYRWQRSAVGVHGIAQLPLGSNGKPRYAELLAQLEAADAA